MCIRSERRTLIQKLCQDEMRLSPSCDNRELHLIVECYRNHNLGWEFTMHLLLQTLSRLILRTLTLLAVDSLVPPDIFSSIGYKEGLYLFTKNRSSL